MCLVPDPSVGPDTNGDGEWSRETWSRRSSKFVTPVIVGEVSPTILNLLYSTHFVSRSRSFEDHIR